MNPPL
jgi:hypothetical protein